MTATTKTRRDLVGQALANLGVLAAGQTPADEDFEAVDAQVDPTLDTLNGREIVTVGDADEIPSEWFTPLAIILANDCAKSFGLPRTTVEDAEAALREMTRGRPTGEPLIADYF
jgi:hypothetical protein